MWALSPSGFTMKTLAVVGARLNSSRLPRKHLMPLAGRSLIQRVVERLRHCKKIDQIVVATSKDNENQDLVTHLRKNQIDVFVYPGNVNALVARIDNAVQHYSCDYLVYICGDCPLIDPAFIDHALNSLQKKPSADTVELRPGVQSLHEGMHFYSASGWAQLVAMSTSEASQEHVGYANRIHAVLNTEYIDDVHDFSHLKQRISVDTPADYTFMLAIYQRWYAHQPPTTLVDLCWVQDHVLSNPTLALINHHVVQKRPDKRYANIAIFCHASERIGLGHLRRCALIAKYMQEHCAYGTHIFARADATELPWLDTPHTFLKDDGNILELANTCQAALVVLDFHPEFIAQDVLTEFCQKWRARGISIIGIDKLGALIDELDHLFVPSFYSALQHAKVSYGWDHYLLSPPADDAPIVPAKTQILICTGGSDALNFGANLPAILENCVPADYELVWVQGPYAKPPELPTAMRWQLITNPKNISELMRQSHFCISVYGISFFEALFYCGQVVLLPSAALYTPEELNTLKKEHVCLICEHSSDINQHVTSLLSDPELRTTLKQNTQQRLHGVRGLEVLASTIQALVRKN